MGPLLYTREEGVVETMATHAFTKSLKVQTRKIDRQDYGRRLLGQKGCISG